MISMILLSKELMQYGTPPAKRVFYNRNVDKMQKTWCVCCWMPITTCTTSHRLDVKLRFSGRYNTPLWRSISAPNTHQIASLYMHRLYFHLSIKFASAKPICPLKFTSTNEIISATRATLPQRNVCITKAVICLSLQCFPYRRRWNTRTGPPSTKSGHFVQDVIE